ncbi:MAG TPA: DUF4231 domain-containing protein [Streptosporangiaceae bacterium]|nr:DUF4231 domain-containing protein [Streptosporangiaceae bacterium]
MDSVTDGTTSPGDATVTVASFAARRQVTPLRRRKVDWILLAFFAINLFFITNFVDIEQLTVANPVHFSYPLWPPHAIVDMVHSYGQKYDPLLMARPAFWRMTIWIDVLWNGPFYVAAIYAISRGREWIRVPALVWSGSMSAVVLIILAEEFNGIHATPHFPIILLLNIPWLALPLGTIIRMAPQHPFTRSNAVVAGARRDPVSPLFDAVVRRPAAAFAAIATRWRLGMKASTRPAGGEPSAAPESYARSEAERVFRWYVKNARASRYRFQISEMILLVASATVPVAGILTPNDARPAAIVGAAVVVLTAFRSVFHFYDNWTRFAGTCAVINAELRLYEARVAPYDVATTRDEVLLRKINSAELTETARWMKLPPPGQANGAELAR